MSKDQFKIDPTIVDTMEYWNTDLDKILWFDVTKLEYRKMLKDILIDYQDLLEKLKYE